MLSPQASLGLEKVRKGVQIEMHTQDGGKIAIKKTARYYKVTGLSKAGKPLPPAYLTDKKVHDLLQHFYPANEQ